MAPNYRSEAQQGQGDVDETGFPVPANSHFECRRFRLLSFPFLGFPHDFSACRSSSWPGKLFASTNWSLSSDSDFSSLHQVSRIRPILIKQLLNKRIRRNGDVGGMMQVLVKNGGQPHEFLRKECCPVKTAVPEADVAAGKANGAISIMSNVMSSKAEASP